MPREELAWIARRARDRALAEHTAEARARELVERCAGALRRDVDADRDHDRPVAEPGGAV